MPKTLRTIIKKKEDHFRSKTPWEGAHSQGKMEVAKVDHGGEHEKNFKAIATKVYNREKNHHGHPPAEGDAEGCYGAAPDMTKEETEEDEEELDEVSKGKLAGYVAGAVAEPKKKDSSGGYVTSIEKIRKNSDNRSAGIKLATAKKTGSADVKVKASEETENMSEGVLDTIKKVWGKGDKKKTKVVVADKEMTRQPPIRIVVADEKIKQGEKIDEMKSKGKGKKSMHNYIMKRSKGKDDSDKDMYKQ